MNNEEFRDLVIERQTYCLKLLSRKAAEYAPEESNRFANFHTAARMKRERPEKALWGMAIKQIVSLQDMAMGSEDISKGLLIEKIGDVINYCHLLEGVMVESGRVTE
jgi:hypothetical protein